jgi:hypothetical protein
MQTSCAPLNSKYHSVNCYVNTHRFIIILDTRTYSYFIRPNSHVKYECAFQGYESTINVKLTLYLLKPYAMKMYEGMYVYTSP